MTHPSDIAGLSDLLDDLREGPFSFLDARTKMHRAAATLDSLTARVKELEAFTKELSDALLTLRPLGGSECFVKRCGAYYADPAYFKDFIKRESDNRHEAMKDLARARKRALRAEQQRDEAYDDLRSLWGADQAAIRICEHCDAWMTVEESARVDDVSLCPKEAYGSVKFPNEKCFKHRAWLIKEEQAAIRRLASGPEGGGPLTAASDGEVG